MIDAFPLSWPVGYKRVKNRRFSPFKQTMEAAQQFLNLELKRLGAKNIIISTNIPVRKDGMMYTDYMNRNILDPGVALYFKYKEKDVSMCCDQYNRVWENIYALGKGIEALRGMERWGVSEFLDRAFTGFKAIPQQSSAQSWYEILGVNESANVTQIKDAYRRMAQIHHPDAGGSSDMFAKINTAYQQGMASIHHA